MYFLQKVFQLRDKANPDMEKPFLEHLEDLRIMITRVLLTLIIATIGCFALQEQVMQILRAPVDQVWATHMQKTMPEGVRIDDWERAKEILDHAQALDPEERAPYFELFNSDTRRLVTAAKYLRAAKVLPESRREPFLESSVGDDSELAKLVKRLQASKAEVGAGSGGNLSMMSALKPTETFLLSMKLSFFAGTVVSFPFLLFFILQFTLPGLHDKERHILWPAMLIGFGLFLLGVLFAYFVVLPRALVFFFEWDQGLGVGSDWRIGWYIGFATQFTLIFGLAFELPVIVMALVKLGLLSYEMMSRTRRYAILAIVVLAAVITPTGDPITLSLMAVPMYLLYELCIWLAWFDEKKEREQENREEDERRARMLADPDQAPGPNDLDATEGDEEEDRGDDLEDEPLYEEEPRDDEDDGPPDSTPDEERRRGDDS